MTRLEELIEQLVDAFAVAPPEAPGLGLAVSEVSLDLPVEARIVRGGAVEMSLPRGMLATGFAFPHGRLRLRLAEEGGS